MSPLDWLWLFFIFSSLQPIIQRSLMAMNRRRILATIAARRDTTVITLIHRQETISEVSCSVLSSKAAFPSEPSRRC